MSIVDKVDEPKVIEEQALFDCRVAYSSVLEELAAQDQRVCAVINDSLSSAKLKSFKTKYPDRFINVGIAEQNLVGVGCGLANSGMIPYLCAASCFLTARAMEQIKVDLAYSKTNVPADPVETAAVMRYSLVHEGPMFLRIARLPVPRVHGDDYEFRLGKAVRLREGSDVTLIANGLMVCRALDAAKALEVRGISARVLNMSTLKPLDHEAILDAARTTRGIVTAEEALAAGGLGGAIAEVLAQQHPTPMRILGVPDVFAPTGKAEFLLEHFGLTAAGIERAALELLAREG